MCQRRLREGVLLLRERRPGADGGAGKVSPFLRRHRANWAIAAAGAVLLAGVGAFGTDHAPAPTLYLYWFGMMLAAALAGALLAERLEKRRRLAANQLALATVLTICLAASMTPVVWVAAAVLLGGSSQPGKMVTLFPQALLIAAAFVALRWVTERVRTSPATVAPAAPAPPAARIAPATRPTLLDRLPERLREAELYAIEAEDHYLRLHTDRGSDLILMRLSDAMDELEGLEGARTHRSWWVARDAILSATRGRGRARLEIKGGLSAPVSRTYAPDLRRAGWF